MIDNKQNEPTKVNLKEITYKFGLLSKKEIDNLPQIAQTTKTDAEIKSAIFKSQAEEDKKLADEIILGISQEPVKEPEIAKKQTDSDVEDGPSVPDYINIQTQFITFDLK